LSDAIIITLRGRPRGKGALVADSGDGHFYLPSKTRDEMAALRYAAGQVMGDRPPLEGPLVLSIIVKLPVPQSWPKKRRERALAHMARPTCKPDWDNFGKLLDALTLIVWVDDRQVVDGRVQKFYSDMPGMFIEVRAIEEGIFG
jgi:Holliday junction resolvase RusA-like endonuclease